jgi:hypothetical protein
MKTYLRFRLTFFCCIFIAYIDPKIIAQNRASTQNNSLSFGNAFNMLNTGTKENDLKATYGAGNLNTVKTGIKSYNQNVQVSYGIPLEIIFEFVAVKTHLHSDIASDPGTFSNFPANVQNAMSNLVNGNFIKISDYNSVNVILNFRFNPAKLVIYGTNTGDFLNNTQSSPWDVGVYKTPNTPVSGSKTMVIKK